MAGEKILIGPKLRELRSSRGLTQAELAREVGVSASYVNLIERNQRSASLKFLISLSDAFGLNWRDFTQDKTGTALSDLRQISRDPAFGGKPPDIEELRSAVDGAPNLVQGFFAIYNAYRAYAERLAEQNEALGASSAEHSIEQTVHDFFRSNNNYFPEIEASAESLAIEQLSDRRDMYGLLKAHLRDRLGVEVRQVRDEVLGSALRHYDPDKKVIYLSDGLDHTNQVFQLGHMIALIGFPDVLHEQMTDAIRASTPATARFRIELANYFAAAVLMPYEAFHQEAIRVKYDIERLAACFAVSYEQVCHRLSTLQRPGKRGIPFFFLRIDRGGNVSKRFNVTPIQLARFGGACPRLDVHYCFRVPGRIITQIVEMPDHSRYLTVNRTVDRPSIRYSSEDKRLSVSIGCPVEYAKETIYGAELDMNSDNAVTPIGINCRLCPRKQCEHRAHDPFISELEVDENRRGITHFES